MDETAENTGQITEKRKGRLENLRPWPKGVSGNPGGRPKGIVAKAVTRELNRKIPGADETVLRAYVRKYIEEAIKECDAARFTSIRDTVDGRPSANESERTNIGQVNINWAGGMPPWAQPSPQPPLTNQPTPLPAWTKPERDSGKSGSRGAQSPGNATSGSSKS